jgi:type III pantothenate kinase
MPSPDIVVDVGNSRIKWGRCSSNGVVASAALPYAAPAVWDEQLAHWQLTGPLFWAVTGVQPAERLRLVQWAQQRGDRAQVVDDWHQLPLRVLLQQPQKVGMDRLFDAVAANGRRRSEAAAILIDAGSAVTVDWLDETGAFRGGAILPGFGLMAKALHEHTALLPLIAVPQGTPPLPGTATVTAMEAGVFWAVVGGVQALIGQLSSRTTERPDIFLTGGDGPILHARLGSEVQHWPTMTLEGIRRTVETLT